jgi:hypothetical protein
MEQSMSNKSIPPDFPTNSYSSSLAGAQPKIAMVEVDGKYYQEGNTPDQQLERYLMCEDLAEQGRAYCKRKLEEGVVSDATAAMERLYTGLVAKNWCTKDQCLWIIQRVATLSAWQMPTSLSGKA